MHFGSRGFGHGIATYFLKLGGGKDGMDVPPLVLPQKRFTDGPIDWSKPQMKL